MHRHNPASVTGFQGNPTDLSLQPGSTSSYRAGKLGGCLGNVL